MLKSPALIAFILALGASLSVQASGGEKTDSGKTSRVAVAYSIAFIGIPFGHTTYDIRIEGDDYRTASHFETRGIVSAFWEATIDASASGRFTPAAISPAEYDSRYKRGEK